MLRLLACVSFGFAVIFDAWHISHGPWTYVLFALIALFLWCASTVEKFW